MALNIRETICGIETLHKLVDHYVNPAKTLHKRVNPSKTLHRLVDHYVNQSKTLHKLSKL